MDCKLNIPGIIRCFIISPLFGFSSKHGEMNLHSGTSFSLLTSADTSEVLGSLMLKDRKGQRQKVCCRKGSGRIDERAVGFPVYSICPLLTWTTTTPKKKQL